MTHEQWLELVDYLVFRYGPTQQHSILRMPPKHLLALLTSEPFNYVDGGPDLICPKLRVIARNQAGLEAYRKEQEYLNPKPFAQFTNMKYNQRVSETIKSIDPELLASLKKKGLV